MSQAPLPTYLRRIGWARPLLVPLALTLTLSAGRAWAQQAPQQAHPQAQVSERPPTPFDQGRIRVNLTGSTGGSSNNRYFVIGAGVGYFVFDGLEVGASVESWLGGDPTITKLGPEVRYIVFQIPYIHPYAGGFYNHWFVHDFDDVDTLGARGGIAIVTGPNLVAGGGVVYEVIVSECEDDCSDVYPEFFVSLAF